MLRICTFLLFPFLAHASHIERDVIVYGGTSAGVTAAIQTSRMGKSVILIEPSQHVGGLTSGGLGMTDSGKREVIGGLSREFYQRLQQHYHQPDVWRQQKPTDYAYYKPTDDAIWRFEPHVAENTLKAMLAEAQVEVVYGERLDLDNGVSKEGGKITEIRMESGDVFRGKIFIDATYEGDLMAKAGVTYTIGREPNSKYDETLNGVQTENARSHQFLHNVDPYLIPGDPKSGLLPGVQAEAPGKEGAGDKRIQAYCFRMCLTDDPANRVAFPKPEGYNPLRYELYLRYILKGWRTVWGNHKPMPNRKTDTNNHGGFSTDNIGMNYSYPDGDYATREAIIKEHETYQKGLFWFLCNDPRVPKDLQENISKWGLAKDEFTDNGNWPHQIYVREARRMVSDYVQTEADCFRTRQTPNSVGMGSYNMDSHHVQRYVDQNGFARNEGDVQVSPGGPYQISYRAIRPKREECQNLLVPAALSSSHIAFGSIRMEPVFMVLGQSAATGACHAIDEKVAVQDIDQAKLKAQLIADKQVLDYERPATKAPIPISKIRGTVVDDTAAQFNGFTNKSKSTSGYVGTGYRHNGGPAKSTVQSAEFTPNLPEDGGYQVAIAFTNNANRATNATVTIHYHGGSKTLKINQRKPKAAPLLTLGVFPFKKGSSGKVILSDEEADGYVIADAVQFYKKPGHQ